MGSRRSFKNHAVAPVVALLAILLLTGACSGETNGNATGDGGNSRGGSGSGGAASPTTVSGSATTPEEPPEITLGEEPGGRPEAILRLEGGPDTTFSGLCTVGGREDVVSVGGRVPKRFTFDLDGSALACRIEKRDQNRGALKVVLITGDTTRSVQQTNSPGATMNVSYRGG